MVRKRSSAGRAKALRQTLIGDALHRYKRGALHSGKETGPIVRNRSQAIAIALSVATRGAKKAGGSARKMGAMAREARKRTAKTTGQVLYSLRKPGAAAQNKLARASAPRNARTAASAAPVRSRSRGPRVSYAGGTLSIGGKAGGGRSAAAKKAWAKRRRK